MLRSSPRARLLLGCVLISFSSIFAKLSSVGPTTSAFYRVAIGGLAFLVLARARRARFFRNPVPVATLVACALIFAFDLGFWHESIERIGPGRSTLLASLQVFFMAGAARVFYGERLQLRQVVAIPLAIIGLGLLVGVDWSILSPEYRVGVLLGVATAASYAGYMLTLRHAQGTQASGAPVAELAAVSLGSAFALGITAGIQGQSLAIAAPIDYLWLGALGLVCHVGGWLLIAVSLRTLSPTVVGLTLTLQPVMTFGWDLLLFDAGINAREAAGVALTIFAIYCGGRSAKPSTPPRGDGVKHAHD